MGQDLLIIEASRSRSVGLLRTGDKSDAETTHNKVTVPPAAFEPAIPGADLRLSPCGHWDRRYGRNAENAVDICNAENITWPTATTGVSSNLGRLCNSGQTVWKVYIYILSGIIIYAG